jgi:hypothetical protein
MSDRGLPIVDGAPACPFVAFEDDRDERATSPDHRHRCYAEVRPAPRALAHQEAYCLASTFPVCPTFQDWARREAAQARAGTGGVQPTRDEEPARRNPPHDWSAPPPWAGSAAEGTDAAAAAGGGGAFDDEALDDESDAPGFLASRSAAAGAGLAGSAADRLAGSGRGNGDGMDDDARYGPADEPEQRPAVRLDAVGEPDNRYDERAADRSDDELEELEFDPEPRGRPRSARASGGISFGRDRRPRVGDTRRAHGWDEVGPSWERPRHNEPYPALKSRIGLPSVSRVGGLAIALVLAAIALFFLPQLLGMGGPPGQTGDRTSAPPGSVGPSVSLEPTPVPAPTPQIYIVKAGDSMFSIAKQFGVALDELIAANREAHPNPDVLQIGDQIIIPSPPPDEIGGSPSPSAAP